MLKRNEAQRNLFGAEQTRQDLLEILQHLEPASVTVTRDQEERSFRDFVNYLVQEDAEMEMDPPGEHGTAIKAVSGVADAIDVQEGPDEESSDGPALDLRSSLLKRARQKEHRVLFSSLLSDGNAQALRSKLSDLEAEISSLEAVLQTSTEGGKATDSVRNPGPIHSPFEEVKRTQSDAIRLQRPSCGLRPSSCQDPARDGAPRAAPPRLMLGFAPGRSGRVMLEQLRPQRCRDPALV